MSHQTGDYHRSCDGKMQYKSEAKAWRAIKGVTRRHGRDGKMNAYRCAFCGFWHIGHARTFNRRQSKQDKHDLRAA